jgi:hypothetical protein
MSEASSFFNTGDKTIFAISAASAVVLGVAGLIFSVRQRKAQERKAVESFFNAKNKKRHDDDSSSKNKKQQKVNLYFNQNDELVDEEVALNDIHNYYHKYHCVSVDFGSNGDDCGIEKLTKEIFSGTQKIENA